MAWLTGYSYRKAITLSRGGVASDLTNFPVKIPLRNTNTFGLKDLTQGITPTASATQAGSAAVNAVDNSTATYWTSTTAGPLPVTLKVDLGANCGVVLGKYTISPRTADANSKPTAWKLQGSNDDSNWTDLDSQTGQTWANDNPVTYTISSPGTTKYRYFRLNISATSGGNYVQIKEWELFQYIPANFDFTKAMANGYDIHFTDDDQLTALKFEREFHGTTQQLISNTGSATADNTQGSYYPSNAVDSNTGTFWATADSGSGHWWKYDYGVGVTKTVVKIAVSPYVNGWGVCMKGFKFQGSNDDSNWTDLYTGTIANSSSKQSFEMSVTGAYRYYRFLSTDATQWSGHALLAMNEIYFYENSTSYEACYWVKIPTLPTASDKVIYMYYGKAGDTDGADKTNVWDSYHKGVWHLSEVGAGAAGEFKDSTTNANNAAGNSTLTRAAGIDGFGQTTTASYNVQAPDHATLEPGTQDLTWSGKFKFSSIGNNCFFGRGTSGSSYFYFAWETSGIRFRDYNSGNIIDFTVTGWTPIAGEWYDIEVTRSGSTFKIFVDNVQVGANQTDADGFLDRAVAWQFGGNTTIGYAFVGIIDEIRMSFGLARADAWRKARIYSDNEAMQSYATEETHTIDTTTYELNPALEWIAAGLTRMSPSLEWFVSMASKLSPSLEWFGTGPKFAPNLVHYPFYFETPSVKNSRVVLGWTGCVPGYTVTMANTGTAGQTVLEVYVQGVLKSTLTVPATSAAYTKLQHLTMDTLVNPLDELELKITDVATGAEDLKVSMYEMTFPFAMEVLDCGNLTEDNVEFWGLERNWLFTEAESWFVETNQPILELVSAVAIDANNSETDITAEIVDGHFYQNRLVVSSTVSSDTVKLRFYVKDLGQLIRTIEKEVAVKTTLADFPDYAIAEPTSSNYLTILGSGTAETESGWVPTYGDVSILGSGTAWSDVDSGPFIPAHAVNNEGTGSYWGSNYAAPGVAFPISWFYDFGAGQERIPGKVMLRPFKNENGGYCKDFDFQGSNDLVNWTTLVSGTCGNDINWYTFTFTNNTAYRYIRVKVKNNYRGYIDAGLYGIKVYDIDDPKYNLIDGYAMTRWPSITNTQVPAYWKYDLGAGNEKAIKQVKIRPYYNSNGVCAKDFTIAGSNAEDPDLTTDTDWTYVYGNRLDNDPDLNGQYQTFSFQNPQTYRHYRLRLSSTYNTAGIAAIADMDLLEADSSTNSVKIFGTYIPFDSYQYSFDNGATWVDGTIIGTKFSTAIDFTGKTEGTYAMQFKYLLNGLVFIASKSIIYTVGDIDASVLWGPSYLQVVYSDAIALEKVDLYLDDVLSGSSVPTVGSGFATCTLSTALQTLTVSAGLLCYQGVNYSWAGTAISLAGIEETDYRLRVAFGFNTSTKEFETKTYVPTTFGEESEESFSNFITIWIQDIYVQYNLGISTVSGGANQWKVFEPDQIPFPVTSDRMIQVIITDVAGRTLTASLDFKVLLENAWYTLTVTDGNGNIVIDGQIVQTNTLTYTVTKDENP